MEEQSGKIPVLVRYRGSQEIPPYFLIEATDANPGCTCMVAVRADDVWSDRLFSRKDAMTRVLDGIHELQEMHAKKRRGRDLAASITSSFNSQLDK